MKKNLRHMYLNEVTGQIKSKEAKEYISSELDYHLMEAKKGYVEKGLTETEAEEKAIEQMGNPIKLGNQLNKIHRPKVDWLMIILLVTTLFLGFLPVLTLDSIIHQHSSIYKTLFIFLGVTVALVMMLIDYRKFKNQGWVFYGIGVVILLALTFLSNSTIHGQPLLYVGPITIESLMAVPFFFLAWASFFNNRRLKIWHFGLLFLLSIILFSQTPSISTMYIYTVMVFVMLWWSKLSKKTIVMIYGVSASSFLLLVILWQTRQIYFRERLLAFLSPEKYADGAGFMILRHKELMSNAGWFGMPMGKEFIPEGHTNFVFVSLTHHYGWLFAIALVIILTLFIVRIIVVIKKINDSYGRLLLIGAVALYAVQLISNIAMSLGFFPLTSMSLPFISYGLMPILLNSMLMGMVLSVYRRKDLVLGRVSA